MRAGGTEQGGEQGLQPMGLFRIPGNNSSERTITTNSKECNGVEKWEEGYRY